MKRSAMLLSSLTICWFTAVDLGAQAPPQSALVEAAKKEGKLVWYTSMAIDTSKPLLDAFQKEYPFIKAELLRAGEAVPKDVYLHLDDYAREFRKIFGL